MALATGFALSGCGGSDIKSSSSGGGDCTEPLEMAVNPWVGYEASAHVVGYLAQHELGCTVNYKNLKEEVSWQGFGSGDVDVVIENWGHDDLKKKYIEGAQTAVDFGPNGNIGHIGWYVPPWLAKAHPDITNWKNLNKYAKNFETSESGGQGQFLDGDPSYVTNDESLVKNLNLDFKVVYAGSEQGLIQAYKTAEDKHQWRIGYWYYPQWFNLQVPMQVVHLPKWTPGCDTDTETVACDYPTYHLDKIVSKKFADSDSPAVALVKNFKWTNDDQNVVARYIAEDKMTADEAAQKWVEANQDKVNEWLQGT